MHRPPTRLPLASATILALALSACTGEPTTDGSTEPTTDVVGASEEPAATETDPEAATETAAGTSDPQAGGFPVTVDADNGEVSIEERPERIVSLSPSATELLFAIGAGDQVVAADVFSTYPAEAPTTDLSGFDPNVEAIVAYEPDLVVIAGDSNDLVASLGELGIPVIANDAPSDVEGGYDIAAGLGLATGHVEETAALVAQMRVAMEEAFAAAPDDASLRVYHEVDEGLFAASSASFIGSIYEDMGVVNIADEADTEGTGYPQLTEESIVAADPQLIVITDLVNYTADDVAARPGWSQIEAVTAGNIVTVSSDVASRWGPRLPELVTTIAEALDQAAVPAGR